MERIVIIKNCSECNESHNNFAMMNGNAPMGVLSGGAFLGCTKTLHLCPDEGIPDWCPHLKLPEYKEEPTLDGWNIGDPITEELTDWLINFGYNQCLHEILDEKED